MIYPNVQIITKNKNIYFADFYNTSIERNTNRYLYLRKDLELNNDKAVVIISQINRNYKKVINFIKENKISTVYFFIDDVFRSSLGNSFMKLSDDYEEIKKIKHIISKTKVKNYKIFHCELVKEKIYDLEINYADLFVNEYVKSGKNHKLQKNKKIIYKISCLNNREDIHRQTISTLLCKKNDVLLTANQLLEKEKLLDNALFNLKNLDLQVLELFNSNFNYLSENFLNYLDPLNKDQAYLKSKIQNNNFPFDSIQKSFLNIITETCYTSNFVNLSEKTFKPIICKRPFLILGVPGCLQHLKDLGFKTFNKWWNESYDLELDNAKRLQQVYYITENILNTPFEDLKIMLNEMNDILEHNHNHLNYVSKHLVPLI
jgi:hypothetical protein